MALAFDFSHHGNALRPIFMLWLVKIWLRKIYAASRSCLLIAEANRVLSHPVMFLTAFLHWMYKMKYGYYLDSLVIHSWFVYWNFGWDMSGLLKSSSIWFWNGIIFVFYCAWRVRGMKSFKRFWPYLMVFRSCISTGKPIVFDVFFSGFMKSRLVYAASLRAFVRLETMIWPSVVSLSGLI